MIKTKLGVEILLARFCQQLAEFRQCNAKNHKPHSVNREISGRVADLGAATWALQSGFPPRILVR